MNILPGSFAVFWSRPGWSRQFHADHFQPTAKAAAAAHRAAFPEDRICSVRGRDGRFNSFKQEV